MKCTLAAVLAFGSASILSKAVLAETNTNLQVNQEVSPWRTELKSLKEKNEAITKEIEAVKQAFKEKKLSKHDAKKKIAVLEKQAQEVIKSLSEHFANMDSNEFTETELKKLAHEINKKENEAEKRLKFAELDYKQGKITRAEYLAIKKQVEADKLDLEVYKLKVMDENLKHFTGEEKATMSKILEFKKRELEIKQAENTLESDYKAGKLSYAEYRKAKKALDKVDDQLDIEKEAFEKEHANYDELEDLLDFDDLEEDDHDDLDDDNDDDNDEDKDEDDKDDDHDKEDHDDDDDEEEEIDD